MKKIACILLSALLIFCTGCIEKKESNLSGRNYIVYNAGEMPENLIMIDNSSLRQKDLLLQVFEGLVKLDENGNICPGIAQSWAVDDTGLKYTFKIRNNAYWSDGTKITPKDFVKFFSEISKLKDENGNNSCTDELMCIFGMKDYIEGKKSFDNVAITASNDILEIRLNSPCTYFISLLCMPEFTLRKFDDNMQNWIKDYRTIKYSGPFTIGSISNGNCITIVKNDRYWQKDQVKSELIMLSFQKSSEISLADFETSKADIFCDPPLSEIKRLQNNQNIIIEPIMGVCSLFFNSKKNSCDLAFREAIDQSIDREQVAQSVFYGTVNAANTFLPYSNIDSSKAAFNSHPSMQNAEKYIKASKYDGKKAIMIYIDSNKNKKLCETIKQEIKKCIGVNVETYGYEKSEINEVIASGNYDIALDENMSSYFSPMSLLKSWSKNLNMYGYKNLNYDNLLDAAKILKLNSMQNEMFEKCETELSKELPFIPLYYSSTVVCKKPEVEGLYITKMGNVMLDRAYVKRDKAYVMSKYKDTLDFKWSILI